MIKRGLTLDNALNITPRISINDAESGLHHDYEVWLERLAPHAPIDQYWHNRTGEARRSGRGSELHVLARRCTSLLRIVMST